MNYKSYFNFSELFKFGEDGDIDEIPEEVLRATGQSFNVQQVSAREKGADNDSVLKHPTYQWQDQRK